MPYYLFQHPDTGETLEVFQKMKDKHEHCDEDGVRWNRVYTLPNASVDTNLNADTTKEEWMRKTENKKWTLGDAWDTSEKLSKQREKKMGKDPLKEKALKNYSKRRNGMEHESQKISTKHWDVTP